MSALLDRMRAYVDALEGLSGERLAVISVDELRELVELADSRRFVRRPETSDPRPSTEAQS